MPAVIALEGNVRRRGRGGLLRWEKGGWGTAPQSRVRMGGLPVKSWRSKASHQRVSIRRLSWRDQPKAAAPPNRGNGPGTGAVAIAYVTMSLVDGVTSI